MAAKKKTIPVKKLKKPERAKPAEWESAPDPAEPQNAPAETPATEAPNEAQPEPETVPDNVITIDKLLREAREKELEELAQKLRDGAKLKASELKKLEAAEKAKEPPPPPNSWLSDPEKIAKKLKVWWVNGEGPSFYVESGENWLRITQDTLVLRMSRLGVPNFRLGDAALSPMEETLLWIQENRMIDRAVEGVAGYKAGVHLMLTRNVLLTRGPKLMTPKEGDWNIIRDLIDSRLTYELHEDAFPRRQVELFHGWFQRRLENVYLAGDTVLAGQALCLCGPAGSAKSRLQNFLITPGLGGRVADPSNFYFKDDGFSDDWIESEHLCTEDPRPSTKMLDRKQFANKMKSLLVNDNQRWRGLYRGALTVNPKFAVSLSFNDSPDEIQFFPPLGPNFRDKILLFRVMKRPLPMPTRTPAEKAAFKAQVWKELPAYIWYLLNEFKLRDGLRDDGQDRFGTKDYADPILRSLLRDDSPAAEFLELIDESEMTIDSARGGIERRGSIFEGPRSYSADEAAKAFTFFKTASPAAQLIQQAVLLRRRMWIGPAGELQEELRSQTSNRQVVARKLTDHNPIPRLLGQIAQDNPERVAMHHFNTSRKWFIMAGTSEVVTDGDTIDAI